MAKTGTSAILGKLKKKGLAKAHRAHKDEPLELPTSSFGEELPSGIENGVAQLTQAELSEHDGGVNKGEPYAMLAGIIKSPESFKKSAKSNDIVKVKGRRCQRFIPLYDTPRARKTPGFEDNWATLLNELRKFNIETGDVAGEDVEDILAALLEEKPFFKFRTWGGGEFTDKESGELRRISVRTDFMGAIEDYADDEANGEVIDSSEEEDEETKSFYNNEGDDEEVDEEEEELDISLQDMGELADDGDEDSIDKLTKLSEKAELDPDAYPTWSELSTALIELRDDEEEEVESVVELKKGDLKVYDGVEIEVQKINKKEKTAEVMDINTEDIWEDVPWEELTEE